MPAAVRIMADAMTGGDTKKLFKMMELGQLDPNTALPKFAMELEARASGGWNNYRNTSRYKQNMSSVALEDNFMLMNQSGGTSAWFRVWSTFAETLPKMAPLFRATGQAMDFLGQKFQGLGDIVGGVSALVGQIQGITYSTEDMSARLGHLAPFLAAFWKRAFAPLYGAYLIIQDIAGYSMGMKSVTGMAFDFLQGKNSTSPTAPKSVTRVNPYAGEIGSGAVWDAHKKMQTDNTFYNRLDFLSKRTGSVVAEHMFRPIIDVSTWALSPNRDANQIRLTPQAQMDSIINNVAFGGNTGVGGMPNFNITINSDSNDPQHLANLVTKAITTQTIPFLLRNNGE